MKNFSLPRRTFFSRFLSFLASTLIICGNAFSFPANKRNLLTMQVDEQDQSSTRLGIWMTQQLTKEEIYSLIKSCPEAERGDNDPRIIKSLIRKDFLTGNIIDIQGIRFSKQEAARLIIGSRRSATMYGERR